MRETFIVKIMYNQNSTWQGSLEWLGKNGNKKSQYFRSALELIRLIDSSIEQADQRDWEEEPA